MPSALGPAFETWESTNSALPRTVPTACQSLAASLFLEPPHSIAQKLSAFTSEASEVSLPPLLLRLLPVERTSSRVGFTPTVDQRLSRRTGMSGLSEC